MKLEHILYEKNDGVGLITINRAEVLNALSAPTMDDLDRVFADAETDATVRVLIITGAGPKAFVSGADIEEISRQTPQTGATLSERGQRVFRRLETMGKPSIAAINGYALGGGLELAMSCTIRIAAQTAKMGLPEVGLGVIPGYGGTQRLPRIVGRGIAMDMLLSGRPVDAAEALRIGLVSQVVPADEVVAAARKTAMRILRNSPLAIRAAMQAVDYGFDNGFDAGCKLENSLFGLLCATPDMREGVGAFLQKRRPEFKGE